VAVKLFIDSNRFTDFARGLAEVVARFESADELWLSLIVLGELRGGFAFGTKSVLNEEILEKFLGRSMVQVLALDEETVDHYAAVYSGLRRGGTPIPTNDMWIAAQAIQHDLILDTRDQHFHYVSGLKLVGQAS
jgi:tRNA(fMet)-specific endonuclease VapC